MRAVKIDPVSRTVTEINLKKNPYSILLAFVGMRLAVWWNHG